MTEKNTVLAIVNPDNFFKEIDDRRVDDLIRTIDRLHLTREELDLFYGVYVENEDQETIEFLRTLPEMYRITI